jgi:hypothetical protein
MCCRRFAIIHFAHPAPTLELPVSIKTPRLIQDRCGVYYFRPMVPLSLRHIVKKTEIWRSLRTKDGAMARQAALLLFVRMEAILAKSKAGPLTNQKEPAGLCPI